MPIPVKWSAFPPVDSVRPTSSCFMPEPLSMISLTRSFPRRRTDTKMLPSSAPLNAWKNAFSTNGCKVSLGIRQLRQSSASENRT